MSQGNDVLIIFCSLRIILQDLAEQKDVWSACEQRFHAFNVQCLFRFSLIGKTCFTPLVLTSAGRVSTVR